MRGFDDTVEEPLALGAGACEATRPDQREADEGEQKKRDSFDGPERDKRGRQETCPLVAVHDMADGAEPRAGREKDRTSRSSVPTRRGIVGG